MKNHIRMIVVIISAILPVLLLAACTSITVLFGPQNEGGSSPMLDVDRQLQQVKTGVIRNDAVKMMTGAWYHGECKWQSGIVNDVFLYGPENAREVQVAVITSKPFTGTLIVVSVTRAENDSLRQYGFEDCVPQWLLNAESSSQNDRQ